MLYSARLGILNAAMKNLLIWCTVPRKHRGQGTAPHPRQAVNDNAPVVLYELLADGQFLLVALINLNPVQRIHGFQPHRHLVFALQRTSSGNIWHAKTAKQAAGVHRVGRICERAASIRPEREGQAAVESTSHTW